ncbi:AtpZ/AtpI family protein [Aquihabitans sp. McL0605]|uniref:AtpZ/AtpI family protein n=1 Tax=Aquihabitans sp. McL0605 TaxID=3415671 RepID=UPI003CF7B96F
MSDSTPLTPGNEAPAAAASTPAATTPVSPRAASADPFSRSAYSQSLNRGYGDAMGRGLELAVTLVFMVGIGRLVDLLFGTYPLFTIVFSVLGFAGITVKLFLGYDLEMKKHEEGAIWNRKSGAA